MQATTMPGSPLALSTATVAQLYLTELTIAMRAVAVQLEHNVKRKKGNSASGLEVKVRSPHLARFQLSQQHSPRLHFLRIKRGINYI